MITTILQFTPVNLFGQIIPELLYYRFNGSGTGVHNIASSPLPGTNATLMGGLTQGGNGICNGTVIGSGAASSTDYVNTNWATNLMGSWSISFKTKKHYSFGYIILHFRRCECE